MSALIFGEKNNDNGWLSATILMLLFGALAKGINNLPKKYFCTFLVKLPATPSRFSVNRFLFPAYSISVLTASGSSNIIKPLSVAS